MGVCVEPIEYVAGLSTFEQYIYRTAVEREGIHDARSKAGDLDLTIYSLRKFMRLALKGNPTILVLFFVPESDLVTMTPEGQTLRELYPLIVSKRAGNAFLGYLIAQKQRLLGERGGRHGIRPELLHRDGYDTKYAMHMLRLGYQGVELLTTGKLVLPMPKEQREFLLSVRRGEVDLNEVTTRGGELERELKDLLEGPFSAVREEPDVKAVEDWTVKVYRNAWAGLV